MALTQAFTQVKSPNLSSIWASCIYCVDVKTRQDWQIKTMDVELKLELSEGKHCKFQLWKHKVNIET